GSYSALAQTLDRLGRADEARDALTAAVDAFERARLQGAKGLDAALGAGDDPSPALAVALGPSRRGREAWGRWGRGLATGRRGQAPAPGRAGARGRPARRHPGPRRADRPPRRPAEAHGGRRAAARRPPPRGERTPPATARPPAGAGTEVRPPGRQARDARR